MRAEVIDAFLSELILDPDRVMERVRSKLDTSRFELKLLKADIHAEWFPPHDLDEDRPAIFPMFTGEKGVLVK